MEKFELNKRVIARMERPEMADVKGGFTYIISGPRGTRMGKRCCDKVHVQVTLTIRVAFDEPALSRDDCQAVA